MIIIKYNLISSKHLKGKGNSPMNNQISKNLKKLNQMHRAMIMKILKDQSVFILMIQ